MADPSGSGLDSGLPGGFSMQFGGPGFGAPFGQTFQPYGQANMQLPQQQQQQAQQQQQTQQVQQQQGDNANEVEQLKEFWKEQQLEVSQVGNDPAEFKNHQLPLARIKKIMKSDEDVRMISAEAPVLFAKACEMFILELTLRSWMQAEDNKRRTLQRNDISAAVHKTEVFDFLEDVVPQEEAKPEDGTPQPQQQQGQQAQQQQPSQPQQQQQQQQAGQQAAQQHQQQAQQPQQPPGMGSAGPSNNMSMPGMFFPYGQLPGSMGSMGGPLGGPMGGGLNSMPPGMGGPNLGSGNMGSGNMGSGSLGGLPGGMGGGMGRPPAMPMDPNLMFQQQAAAAAFMGMPGSGQWGQGGMVPGLPSAGSGPQPPAADASSQQ